MSVTDAAIGIEVTDKSRSTAGSSSSLATVGDYVELLKPRVMSLVIFTSLVGMMIAPGSVHPILAVTALLCIAVGAGASGALNMWFDADIDGRMARTAQRPIPLGRVNKDEALAFGITLSLLSVMILAFAANYFAAGLLAFTIGFYVLVYTMWLKRRTQQNIVIGGAAGALPPVIGWAAVTGSIAIEPLILFLIIFLWTPPHFWALALVRSSDYENVGVPMMPVTAGQAATRRQVFFYTLLLVASSGLPVVFGFAGVIYAICAVASGAVFVHRAWRLLPSQRKSLGAPGQEEMRLFAFSIAYLFLLFAALLVERLISYAGVW